MQIRSIVDVITNSSSEVFVFKQDDPDYEEIKKKILEEYKGDDVIEEFKTLDDVKNRIFSDSCSYSGWEEMYTYAVQNFGRSAGIPLPTEDTFKNLEPKDFTDLNWEKYKDNYKPILGHTIAYVDNDYIDTGLLCDLDIRIFKRDNIIPIAEKLILNKCYSIEYGWDEIDMTVEFVWKGINNPPIVIFPGQKKPTTFNSDALSFLCMFNLGSLKTL